MSKRCQHPGCNRVVSYNSKRCSLHKTGKRDKTTTVKLCHDCKMQPVATRYSRYCKACGPRHWTVPKKKKELPPNTLKFSDLNRHCCGRKYIMHRTFENYQTQTYFFLDGVDYKSCKVCGKIPQERATQ